MSDEKEDTIFYLESCIKTLKQEGYEFVVKDLERVLKNVQLFMN